MQAKIGSKIRLALVALVAVFAAYLALCGVRVGKYVFNPYADVLPLGLDLRGGVSAEYKAAEPSAEGLDAAVRAISVRLAGAGLSEATVRRVGDDRIRVEIPGSDEEGIADAVGVRGHLEFLDPDGNVILEGKDIVASAPSYSEDSQAYALAFQLNAEGTARFAEATARLNGKAISIRVDGVEVSAPTIGQAITGGTGQIPFTQATSAEDSLHRAEALALQLKSGELPLTLEKTESRGISATLGSGATRGLAVAAVAAVLIAMIAMVVVHRLPGAAAALSLLIYALAAFALLCELPDVVLSLSSVAGIALGFAAAVAMHLVLLESFRDELEAGRPAQNALKFGDKAAIPALFDLGIAASIAAGLMLWLGEGAVRSFAQALLSGVLTAFVLSLTLARFLLKHALNLGFEDRRYFARPRRAGRPLAKRFKVCLIASCAVVAVALVMQLVGVGLNPGQDFAGGSVVRFSVGAEYDASDAEGMLNAAGIDHVLVKSGTDLEARLPLSESAERAREALEAGMPAKYPDFKFASTDRVYASAGGALIGNALKALGIAALCALVYLAFRFGLAAGAASLIALVHDGLIAAALTVLFRWAFRVDVPFAAALLAVALGSLGGSALLFERVRESARKPGLTKLPRAEIAEIAVGTTLGRTLLIAALSLAAPVLLLILGTGAVRAFAFPLAVGTLAAAYSSVMLTGPIWAKLAPRANTTKTAKRPAKGK
ncbi:MAG: bifunctional preprotein translocase subunit SecD/SecF [Firmicutes bacterium ADurb.Bin467]|nr:MAG: bifunctional preprotein translocase subunit SecD/SecF [Firmicutes bacterium ADurb.Bin467]